MIGDSPSPGARRIKIEGFPAQQEQAPREALPPEERIAELEDELRSLRQENHKLLAQTQEMPALLERARSFERRTYQLELELNRAAERVAEQERQTEEAHRETQRLAFQDTLTGLANLNLIRQYLDLTVRAAVRYGRQAALLVVDLDHFKVINEAMGLEAGDELLKLVAERLQTIIRESDALGRQGEDEFLILLTEVSSGEGGVPLEVAAVTLVAHRIMNVLLEPFLLQGQAIYVNASVGISLCPGDAGSVQEMLEHAHSALGHAKDTGRRDFKFFTQDLKVEREERLRLEAQLRQALERGEFVIEYQPIVELHKGKARPIGVEALVRWNHRLEGRLLPHRFLPIAESTGLIVPLGEWVLTQVCQQMRNWRSQGLAPFVTVNLSPRQLMQTDLIDWILRLLGEHGVAPQSLFLEVAEGLNTSANLLDEFSQQLDRSDIGLSIDDFGSGVSCLTRLVGAKTRILKIAPSIVAASTRDKNGAKVCSASIELASGLGLTPLAKGVETAAQAKFLANQRCRYAQGYFFSVPTTAEEIAKIFVRKRSWSF